MSEMSRLLNAINEADDILLITHINPDGDACGSTKALYRALLSLGKHPVMVCDGTLPDKYSFTSAAGDFVSPDDVNARFDLCIALDCADIQRLGSANRLFEDCRIKANVDHHGTNPLYADINIVRQTSATGVIVFELIRELCEPDALMCRLLYTAISTDTGNFMYSNVCPEAFSAMAFLCDKFDYENASRELFATRSFDDVSLLGAVLSSVELHSGGRICVASVGFETLNKLQVTPDYDTAVAFLTSIDTVKIALFLRQIAANAYKVSLRSKGDIDIASFCERYGGGGHKNAAGCRLNDSKENCIKELLPKLTELL